MRAPDKAVESLSIATKTISALEAVGFAGVLISAMGWEDKLQKLLDMV
jgi:hypothetical protein